MEKTSKYVGWDGHLTLKGIRLRDRLSRRGIPILSISRRLGVERQSVDQGLRANGHYQNWQRSNFYFLENRVKNKAKALEYKEERGETLQIIAGQIEAVAERQVEPDKLWAYKKAMEYRRLDGSKLSFETAFGIYQLHYYSQNNGQDLSLETMGKPFGIFPSSVLTALRKVGLRAFRTIKKREVLTPEKIEKLERVVEVPMSFIDLGHFTEISYYLVSQYYKNHPKRKGLDYEDKQIFDHGVKGRLNYSSASKLYEAIDAGFDKKEAMEYAGVTETVFDEAVGIRSCIEPIIISVLKKANPSREVRVPYKDWKG